MAGDEFWGIDRNWIPATEIGKKVNSYTHKMYRRPMTETSSQTTDTCPDCSEHPCDCGLPAGYQADIRFAANFAPHIKVMEASKVEDIIQQIDDLLRYNEAFRQETLICANCDAISKEEYDQAIKQRDAAREEIERLQCAGIHSCHDNCERPNCVLRREIKAITEQRDGLRAGIDCASDQLRRVTEQRDSLADLVKQFIYILDITEESDGGRLFHPTSITSCRAGDLQKIGELVEALRRASRNQPTKP